MRRFSALTLPQRSVRHLPEAGIPRESGSVHERPITLYGDFYRLPDIGVDKQGGRAGRQAIMIQARRKPRATLDWYL